MHRSLPLIHLTHHEREGKQFLERPSLDVQRRKRIGAEWLLLDPVLTYFGGCCCRRVAAGDTVNVRSLQSSGSSGGAAAKQSCSKSAVVGDGEESDTKLLDKWNSLTGLSGLGVHRLHPISAAQQSLSRRLSRWRGSNSIRALFLRSLAFEFQPCLRGQGSESWL